MQIRNRILKFIPDLSTSQIEPHPQNWRLHPDDQKDALAGILSEVGWANVVVVREIGERRYQLIDGHMRVKTAGNGTVPAVVLDVTEDEARKLLISLDPIAAMAEADANNLEALLRCVQTGDAALATMWDALAQESGIVPATEEEITQAVSIPDARYCIMIECADEAQQLQMLEKFAAEGLLCRSMIS